jgi:phosphoribosylformylglycinamidine synthase
MQTIIALISKVNDDGLIYWIDSKKPIDSKLFDELNNDPDTILLINPINEWHEFKFKKLSVVNFLPGVTDNSALVFKDLINLYHEADDILSVHSGRLYFDFENIQYNSLIENFNHYDHAFLTKNILPAPFDVEINHQGVLYYDLFNLSKSELLKLSIDKKWALSFEELEAIKEHFYKDNNQYRLEKGLEKHPTDVEIEIIAQTWSEHCKHKIFNAEIDFYEDRINYKIDSLYKTYIKGATKVINKDWAVSVFSDNAGIVDWDEYNYLAIKVETHNSPSALDPYGGALTGILGVNRDILGTGLGFKPIANTNIFCVGNWDESNPLPSRIKHPRNILTGIHRGIEDGGNKSGIPTVNGAMAFDDHFTGKPLVYCGTIGIAPKKSNNRDNAFKYHESGHLIMMAGGKVGHDGIHGATMSSIAMNETVPNTMVQIGDPFTQKKLTDFILKLRDLGLIEGITDNGAGGLSSSIGEMAERTNGAYIDVSLVPLKYRGLSPWEIIVSESQERMSFAILPENLDTVLELSKKYNVETSMIGEFQNTGYFEIRNKQTTVGLINLDFLHNGIPRLKLSAKNEKQNSKYQEWKTFKVEKSPIVDLENCIKKVIADKNIVSKKSFTENYDHEVLAATIVKGLDGQKQNSPNDGGAIWLYPHNGNAQKAIAVGNGLQYMFSSIDCELMAKLAFDEAMRSVVVMGANPDKVAMCDNFCWPDPIKSESNLDGDYKLYQLVKANQGLFDIATKYKVPLISGKDSMKNDFIEGDTKISVPPTLLMSAIGLIERVSEIKKTAFKENQLVYRLGLDFGKNYFGHFLAKYFTISSNHQFNWNLTESIAFYQHYHRHIDLISAAHDISEGGAIISLSESLFLNHLGINIAEDLSIEELFSEYPTQFIVSIHPSQKIEFENTFKNYYLYLGKTDNSATIKYKNECIKLSEVFKVWSFEWK